MANESRFDASSVNNGPAEGLVVPEKEMVQPIIFSWKDGTTKTTKTGFPPSTWIEGVDGYWYPPGVEPIGGKVDPFIPTAPIIETLPISGKAIPGQLSIVINMNIGSMPKPSAVNLPINVKVFPAIPVFSTSKKTVSARVAITPISMKLEDASLEVIKQLVSGKIENFFDDTRQLKTVLNFGEDFQTLITNWRCDPTNESNLLVKLYRPLPDDVDERTQLWISRELSPPVIDRLYVKYTPPPAPKVYLRPPNRNIQLTGINGVSVENITYNKLFSTGAMAPIGQNDPVLEEWFTDDINSVELNIDYSDYRNFISFGSARNRILAFTQKLTTLEDYNKIIFFNSSSLTTVTSQITGALSYPAIKAISDKRIDLIRSFDPYERFLYYQTDIPYSASFGDDLDDVFFYHSDATWPKSGSLPIPVASASSWLETQLTIATAFDRQNQNRLVNNLPTYLHVDEESEDFIKFVDMIGHQFDLLKPYIDQMTKIYDRGNDPHIGLSPDIIWNIAEGFGIQLPNQYSINTLIDYTIGEVGGASSKVYREAAAETWKRFLHNQIFLSKTKGTKTALRALANCYGILPTTLQIRESVTPGVGEPSSSFEIYEEQTNSLRIPSGSFVSLPWATASLLPETVEFRFSSTNNSVPTTLLNADNIWAVQLTPLSGSYGCVTMLSGSMPLLSSSYMPIFNGEFYSTMVRYNASGMELQLKRADGDSIVDSSETVEISSSLADVFYDATWLHLGGSGSFFGTPFSGLVDEFRVWEEFLIDSTFDNHVKYPGLYAGNTTTSARDNLAIRLSFNLPKNLGGGDKTILNESPNAKNAIPILKIFNAVNFPSITSAPYNMEVTTREVTRYNLNAGANQFSTNKIIVADPPILQVISGSNIPVLSTDKSIVSIATKEEQTKSTNVVGFYFSITDAINDSIIRSIGNIDLANLIGDPSDQYSAKYLALEELNKLYWDSYAYNYNVNSFVDFVRNLLDPLFRQAKELIPARAKLLSGIVHEPHILERSKIQNKPIKVSAGKYGHDNEMQNLEASTVTSKPASIFGGYETVDARFIVSDQWLVEGNNSTLETELDQSRVLTTIADYQETSAIVDANEIQLVHAELSNNEGYIYITEESSVNGYAYYFDDSTNLDAFQKELLDKYHVTVVTQLSGSFLREFNHALASFRSPSTINIRGEYLDPARKYMQDQTSDEFVPQTIQPFTNFDDIESYTYFTDPTGLIGTSGIDYVRTNQNILVDRGNWEKGTVYSRNDVILQSGIIGDGSIGNEMEYVCISTDGQFTSYIEPYLDTKNWKAVSYIPIKILVLKKAVIVDDKVTVAPLISPKPIAVGYRPTHYRFTRDRRKGILNHLWLGCLQTLDTTTDGKPPVEETKSGGDILIVNNGSEPVQSSQEQTGPILDVR